MSLSLSRSTIFVSYSHKDPAPFLEHLQTHLESLKENSQIKVWADTDIEPGMVWREVVAEAIQTAKVAIFLVSANFLASKFIRLHELPPLLLAAQSEGVVIILVLISDCDYENSVIGRFQCINDPGKPLDCLPVGEQHKVWKLVIQTINGIFKNISILNVTAPLSSNSFEEKSEPKFDLASKEALRILKNQTLGIESRVSILFTLADMVEDLDEAGRRYILGRLHRIRSEEESVLLRNYITLVLGLWGEINVYDTIKSQLFSLYETLPPNLQKRMLNSMAQYKYKFDR